jgi:ubiquinone/menaquinone biosynthesis C-methylase UbiE
MREREREKDLIHKNISFIEIPTVPNAPLIRKNDKQTFGKLKLRKNEELNFIHNIYFKSTLIKYDHKYQNNQAHSDRFLKHLTEVMEILKKELPKNSKVVDVGCGKGDFVELLNKDGYFNAYGYDAAYEGSNKNIFKRYLSSDDQIDADLVILRHVLEHIEKPHKFLDLIKNIFKKGKIYIEVPSYDWIVENQTFFDITYEHVNYFTQKSLRFFFDDKNLICNLIYDNQYQYIISKIQNISNEFMKKYNSDYWVDINFYELFPNIKNSITEILNKLKIGGRIYIWGAATKGCMFLVHCKNLNLLLDKINFTIDINPNKQNKFLPCSLISIKSKEEFFEVVKTKDLLLISNRIYKDEILRELYLKKIKDLDIVLL